MKEKTCCFSGHRPERLDEKQIEHIKKALSIEIESAIRSGYEVFISGMARGFDMWAAQAVLAFKCIHPHIKLKCIIPCEEQADFWNTEDVRKYFFILGKCDEIITVAKHYTSDCMFKRNRYMADNSSFLICAYDGTNKGGTAYTVKYANRMGVKIINIFT